MTAVATIIRDALLHLKVIASDETPEAQQYADGMRQLNLMMRRWEADGIAVGWVDVDNPDDVLPAPAEIEEAIGYNLALKMRPRFGVNIEPDVIEFARAGKMALLADIASRDAARLSYDLPRASSDHAGDFYTGE